MGDSSTVTLDGGTQVPLLGYGTATALYRKDAKKWVKIAFNDAHLRHIDTTAFYGNEVSVGAAWRSLRLSESKSLSPQNARVCACKTISA